MSSRIETSCVWWNSLLEEICCVSQRVIPVENHNQKMARVVTMGSLRVSSTSLTTTFARSNAWTTYRDLSSLKCGVFQKMSPLDLRQLRVSRNVSPLSYTTNSAIDPSRDEESNTHGPSVRRLRDLLETAGGKVVALTGAGVSTDSGIPDYRGPQGSYSWGHKPMTHDEFLSSEGNQKRYWFRSMFGWTSFAKARPNAAHFALADLEAAGKVTGVITQNVDGLHQKAGSRNVIDMHGRNDRVKCMSCGNESDRNAYQVHLARINSSFIAEHAPVAGRSGDHLRADGDADVEAGEKLRDFVVCPCPHCGGVLKPTVVFFGDNIPRPRVEETFRMVDASDVLIAAGSSLQVYSAFRLVKRAADAGKHIVVVNLGDTRAERSGLDLLKVEAGVSAVLPQLL